MTPALTLTWQRVPTTLRWHHNVILLEFVTFCHNNALLSYALQHLRPGVRLAFLKSIGGNETFMAKFHP